MTTSIHGDMCWINTSLLHLDLLYSHEMSHTAHSLSTQSKTASAHPEKFKKEEQEEKSSNSSIVGNLEMMQSAVDTGLSGEGVESMSMGEFTCT